jgi:hypothetical protein
VKATTHCQKARRKLAVPDENCRPYDYVITLGWDFRTNMLPKKTDAFKEIDCFVRLGYSIDGARMLWEDE